MIYVRRFALFFHMFIAHAASAGWTDRDEKS
jgi:hypothetical protein